MSHIHGILFELYLQFTAVRERTVSMIGYRDEKKICRCDALLPAAEKLVVLPYYNGGSNISQSKRNSAETGGVKGEKKKLEEMGEQR
jgi:hypothetical protein